ncbi:MAG: cistern family PEP-CTERM protein [Caulobacterales bacterium]|nr:cistern family PEP-CTERM protein [Caulobacterales bacterium]
MPDRTFSLAAPLAAVTAALALAAGGPAAAAVTSLTFTTPGAPEPQVYIAGYQVGTTALDAGLHSTFAVSLVGVSNNGYQWNFGYTLSNTSTEASRLSTIGWDVGPDLVGASGLSGAFGQYAEDGQLASLGTFEFCLKDTGGASCSGGGSGGVASGQVGTGAFSLNFESAITTYVTVQTPVYNKKGKLIRTDTSTQPVVTAVAAPTSVTFSNFGVHYQSLAGGFSTVGVPGDIPLPPPPPPPLPPVGALGGTVDGALEGSLGAVPEPAAWTLMILGFGAVGAMLRRRQGVAAG